MDFLFSLTSYLKILTSVILFQSYWPPRYSCRSPGILLPQNIYTDSFLYLEYLVSKYLLT